MTCPGSMLATGAYYYLDAKNYSQSAEPRYL
jgi:hypothetical protein